MRNENARRARAWRELLALWLQSQGVEDARAVLPSPSLADAFRGPESDTAGDIAGIGPRVVIKASSAVVWKPSQHLDRAQLIADNVGAPFKFVVVHRATAPNEEPRPMGRHYVITDTDNLARLLKGERVA